MSFIINEMSKTDICREIFQLENNRMHNFENLSNRPFKLLNYPTKQEVEKKQPLENLMITESKTLRNSHYNQLIITIKLVDFRYL